MSLFLIDAISSFKAILYVSYFIASSNTIGSYVAKWQYSVRSSSIGLVISYKSSRLLIFLGGLGGLSLLELLLEEDDEGKV